MSGYDKWWLGMAFGSPPNDPNPIWTDVTPYVEAFTGHISATSGASPETTGDTGSFVAQLKNSDQRFTPGNMLSPHYPNIKSGVQVWLRETIGYETFDIFRGHIGWPEIESWALSTASAPRDQAITITAVDRLAWLATAPPFISTVAAHILGNGTTSTTLVAYYPLNDGPKTFRAEGPVAPEITAEKILNLATTPLTPATITAAGGGAPPGDDITALVLRPDVQDVLGTQTFISSYQLTVDPTVTTLAAGEVLTILLWIRPDEDVVTANQLAVTMSIGAPSTIMGLKGNAYVSGVASKWEVGTSIGPTGSVLGTGVGRGVWDLIGFQFAYSPNTFNLFSGGKLQVGVLTGVHFGSAINSLWVEAVSGRVAHLQIYKGAFTAADYVAQRQVGLYGLEGQTTGARIRTVAQYAGVPAGELALIDPGVSYLQRATLAGRTPTEAMSEAVETEQGDLHANGAGRTVFADRRRLYNV